MAASEPDSQGDLQLKQALLAEAKLEECRAKSAQVIKAIKESTTKSQEGETVGDLIEGCRVAHKEALEALERCAAPAAPGGRRCPRRRRRCCRCGCCCCCGPRCCGALSACLLLLAGPEIVQSILFYHAASVARPGPVASRLEGFSPRPWEVSYEMAGGTLAQMTAEEKHGLISGTAWTAVSLFTSPIGPKPGWYTGNTLAVPRLGLPALKMQDAANGFRPTTDVPPGTTTCWPSLLALAATWDDALVEEVARDIGVEFRGKGANVILGPSVQVHRTAWGGRNFEYLAGEDPYLGARLTRAYIRGVQGEGIIAVAKHFAMNEQELNRMSYDVVMKDERVAWELYYPPFEAAVEEGVCAFMCSYNKVNGTPSCHNRDLLTRDLRERMGFKGFVQSDWFANYWSSQSVLAGLDQEMPGIERGFTLRSMSKLLKDPVEGESYRWAVDNATLRILATIYRQRLDETADASCDPPRCIAERLSNQRTPRHRQRAAEAATKSVVLLKNDGVLPLNRSAVRRLAVVGLAADAPLEDPFYFAYMGGGSGTVWPGSVVTPLQGIAARAAREGIEVVSSLTFDAEEVLRVARPADVVIVVDAISSTEGIDRNSAAGPQHLTGDLQTLACPKLVGRLHSAGKDVVVLLQTPGAVVMPWLPQVKAVANLFLAGEETGTAWANILFGDASPEGKLPIMFPETAADAVLPSTEPRFAYDEGLFTSYRNPAARAAFPFGHGLSYTRFDFGPAEAAAGGRRCPAAAEVCARLTVTNAGERPGAEVVQAYLEFESARDTPARILRGYHKTRILKPGETEEAFFQFSKRDLSVYVVGPGWTVQEEVKAHFGSSSADLRQSLQLRGGGVIAIAGET